MTGEKTRNRDERDDEMKEMRERERKREREREVTQKSGLIYHRAPPAPPQQ